MQKIAGGKIASAQGEEKAQSDASLLWGNTEALVGGARRLQDGRGRPSLH
jgi:hypothetical protein